MDLDVSVREIETSVAAGKRMGGRPRPRFWARVHLITGLAGGVWLLLMAVTGVLINHQEALGLGEVQIANRYLPAHYTDEFHPDSNSLAVILGDLHSGRFFSDGSGKLVADLAALLLVISVTTGTCLYWRHRPGRN